ncbi:helix-turn-helix domain-containing protein [Paracoccus sp. M683]|uniref:helix-turn-helix domain-containing protein n=1 Tax=Paracoccus sp. M683 TaxID=2594268 RepID=UPI002107DB48|nr:helix-turn-helix domain-containing protein [Paracoccus sp. M683]
MSDAGTIPVFNLFCETAVFPDVVHCERVLDRAGLHDWVISPHRHGQMSQIFHIERGSARLTLDGASSRLEAGEYLFMPPQVVHGFAFSQGTEGVVLSFPSPVIARLGPRTAALNAWLAVPQQGPVSPATAQLIAMTAEIYGSAGMFRAQRLIAVAHALLAGLAEESLARDGAVQEAGRQMQRLDGLIAEHQGKGWGARDYASALHVTTGHLNRIVRGATGRSLTTYLETALMTEACRLIAFTRLPLAEVGYRLGFPDPSYFSRRFRLRVGRSPTDYRATVLNGGKDLP